MSLAKRLLELPEKSALRKQGQEFLSGQKIVKKTSRKTPKKKKS